jgi:hypothetical protein
VDLRARMNIIKNDFVLLLENKFKEGQMLHAHKNGLWSIISKGREVCDRKN